MPDTVPKIAVTNAGAENERARTDPAPRVTTPASGPFAGGAGNERARTDPAPRVTTPASGPFAGGAGNERARTEAAARWRDEWAALRRRDRDAYPDVLAPPDVFTDEVSDRDERRRCGHEVPDAETGPDSRTVTSRLRMSCTEWPTVPTARDLHRAIHQPRYTADETALLLIWFHEADTAEQLYAQLEGAYSWRTLAVALHRVGLVHGEGARRINRFATP